MDFIHPLPCAELQTLFVAPHINACPIRMSYVLNQTGFLVRKSARYATVSGGDHMQYLYCELDYGALQHPKF